MAYLSRETVKWLKFRLEHAKITQGAVFRRLIGADQIGDALDTQVLRRSSSGWRSAARSGMARAAAATGRGEPDWEAE